MSSRSGFLSCGPTVLVVFFLCIRFMLGFPVGNEYVLLAGLRECEFKLNLGDSSRTGTSTATSPLGPGIYFLVVPIMLLEFLSDAVLGLLFLSFVIGTFKILVDS